MPIKLVRKVDIVTGEMFEVEEDVVDFETPVTVVDISKRQFFQQLAIDGRISEAEALAAVATGTLPAAIEAIFSAMSVSDQFAARMLLSGATMFDRSHPLVAVFATAIGMDSAALDVFWTSASEL